MLLDAWFPPFCSLKWQKQGWADLALQGAKSYRAAWLIDDLHWKWFSFQNEFRNHWVHNMKPVSYCPWCYLFMCLFIARRRNYFQRWAYWRKWLVNVKLLSCSLFHQQQSCSISAVRLLDQKYLLKLLRIHLQSFSQIFRSDEKPAIIASYS